MAYLSETILTGVIVGIIANALFLITLSRLRPRVEISTHISKSEDELTGMRYRVKIINRTRWPIIETRAQLHLVRIKQEAGGSIERTTAIPLVQATPLFISKFSKDDPNANYAYRFATQEPLESIWTDDAQQFLRFRLICKHSLSSFGGAFVQDFRVKRHAIKEGNFVTGDSFEIV